QYFPPLKKHIDRLTEVDKIFRKGLQSDEFATAFLQRFSHLKKQNRDWQKNYLIETKTKAFNYLDTVKQTFLCVQEIFTLPKNILNQFLHNHIAQKAEWASPL